MDCIFCKIIAGEIPSHKIAENDDYLAILDIAQLTEGHTIIIPKKHHEFIWDIENISSYAEFIKEIGNHYRKLGFKYIDTLTFGRMIPHCHVHLVPHNNDNEEWHNALEKIGDMQIDPDRRIDNKKGEELVERFKYEK